MDVVVVGKHGEVDARLRALTVEKVERVAKFVNDVRRIDVDYAHNQTRRADDSHTCEILVHVRQHLVKGSAASAEYLISLDRALDKVEQQMRRLHGRRVGRRNGTRARDGAHAAADTNLDAVGDDDHTLAEVEGDDSQVVVKTKQFHVKPMDVDEAKLQMELLGHDFYVFTNADSGMVSVMYRRRDGRLGLIEARR
jgi:putative sigma-54 modulation protein